MLCIGICGRPSSGKDSVVQRIASVNKHVLHINMDIFFKNKTKCLYNGKPCWEHTDVIWFDRLFKVVYSLMNGGGVIIEDRSPWYGSYDCEIFPYDLYESRIIIVQGYLLFTKKELVDLFDNKVFIDVSDKNILIRRPGEYTKRVVIPVSKEYEQEQKNSADVPPFDGNPSEDEVLQDVGAHLDEFVRGATDMRIAPPLKRRAWKVKPGDLLSDHEWHPIDFDDLKRWAKDNKDKMNSGEELRGNTFEYRKDPFSGNYYEVRLSNECGKYRHIFRYTLEPTQPKKPA